MGKIERNIRADWWEALAASNSPGAVNAIATLTDVLAGGGGNQVISGTAAYSGVGLDYDVSTLVYTIQGTLYTSAPTTVTLTSDALNPKIVVIAANELGGIDVIDGVPAPSPVKPQVDSLTQVEVTFVTIPAGATAPGITIELVYNENVGTGGAPAEWNTSTTASVNLNATTDPYIGTVHIATTAAFGTNKNIIFDDAPYTMNGGLLTFWLKAKSNMGVTTGKFLIGFFVGGSLVGNSVTIGGTPSPTFGFSGGVIGSYQLVTIPISAFGGLPASIDQLRIFTLSGANTAEFDLDYIRILESVATPPAPIEGHAVEDEGVALTQRPTIDFQGAGVTATDDPINDKTVVTIPAGTLPSLTELYDWVGDATNTAVERRNSFEPFITGSSPTVNDDETLGYRRGSMVFDFSVIPTQLWICSRADVGNALWHVVNNEVLRYWQNLTVGTDTGFTWGTTGLVPNAGSTLQLIEGSGITLETDGAARAVRISATGGGGGGGWFPTGITLGDVVANGATAALAVGAGYYYTFDATSDDEIVVNIGLARNGVAYDASSVRLDLHNMLVGAGGAGDTVLWEVDYAWVNTGDNAYTAVDGTITNSVDVSARASQILFTDSLTIPAGTAGDKILQLTIRRNSQGAGSDSFGGSVEIYALDLVKL